MPRDPNHPATRGHPARVRRCPHAVIAAGWLGVWVITASQATGQTDPPPAVNPETDPSGRSVVSAAAEARDPSLAPDLRRAALITLSSRMWAGLSERGAEEAAALDIWARLTDPPPDAWLANELLIGLGERPIVPPALYPGFRSLVDTAPASSPAVIGRAASGFRSRDAAGFLLALLRRAEDADHRAAYVDALERLSGRSLGSSADRWGAWLADTLALSDDEWRSELFESLAARADRVADAERATTDRLVQAHRALHLATPPGERGPLLATMLLDAEPRIQRLGVLLTRREISAAAALGRGVEDAALELLNSPNADLRRDAAVLIQQLGAENPGPRTLTALSRETDASAATAMLRLLARWPTEGVLSETARRLDDTRPEVAAAASEAWRSALTAGFTLDGAELEQALARARAGDPMTPDHALPLVLFGTDTDRARVSRSIVEHHELAEAAEIADAISSVPEGRAVLAVAAEDSGAAVVPWLRCTLRFAIDSADLLPPLRAAVAIGVDPRSEFEAAGAAVALASTIEIAAAVRPTDPGLAADLLLSRIDRAEARLAIWRASQDAPAERSASAPPEDRDTIFAAQQMAARCLLEADRADEALVVVQSLGSENTPDQIALAEHEMFGALIALGRFDAAYSIRTSPADWLAALADARDGARHESLRDAIESRFGAQLNDDERAEFERLTLNGEPEGQPGGGLDGGLEGDGSSEQPTDSPEPDPSSGGEDTPPESP